MEEAFLVRDAFFLFEIKKNKSAIKRNRFLDKVNLSLTVTAGKHDLITKLKNYFK